MKHEPPRPESSDDARNDRRREIVLRLSATLNTFESLPTLVIDNDGRNPNGPA
jgi:hypothetical protein